MAVCLCLYSVTCRESLLLYKQHAEVHLFWIFRAESDADSEKAPGVCGAGKYNATYKKVKCILDLFNGGDAEFGLTDPLHCEACPDCIVCDQPGVSGTTIQLQPGFSYAHASNNASRLPSNIFKCANPDACNGGSCAAGYGACARLRIVDEAAGVR